MKSKPREDLTGLISENLTGSCLAVPSTIEFVMRVELSNMSTIVYPPFSI